MANYWSEDYNGISSDPVTAISVLQIPGDSFTIYASGESIDFNEFFSRTGPRRLNCVVKDSQIAKVSLKNSTTRTGYENQIIFENCTISEFKITGLSISSLEFSRCTIDILEIISKTTINKLEIRNRSIFKNISILDATQIENFEIENIKSSNTINISGTRIDNITIEKSTINSFRIDRNYYLNKFIVRESAFTKLHFEDVTLLNKLEISECLSGAIDFKLCRLELENFTFTGCKILLSFHKVRSSTKKVFNFHESYHSRITFERCYFQGEIQFVGRLNPVEKCFNINYTVFKDLVLFDDDHCKGLVIKESLFQKGLLLPIPILEASTDINSSIWCILKNQALARNDNINAMEYRKKELLSYTQELKRLGTKHSERFVLFLNKISNNHGINWLLGIAFTLSAWFLFYILFVMAEDNFYCLFHKGCSFILFDNKFWANGINYLWIPQGLNDLSLGLYKNNFWLSSLLMIIFFILGKILIAYGIFQTISAFRRHGKVS